VTRFLLEHRSRQPQSGVPRNVHLEVTMVCVGQGLATKIQVLQVDTAVHVDGFLGRAGNGGGLKIRATRLQTLSGA
jgi:primosomal replication protein N